MARNLKTYSILNAVLAIVSMFFALTACVPRVATGDEISHDQTAQTDTQEDASESTSSIIQESDQSPFILETVDETETGYILRGKFLDSVGLPENTMLIDPSRVRDWWKIMDADGQAVDFDFPETFTWGIQDDYYFPWVIELKSKQYNWPLTITIEEAAYAILVKGEFNFDAGSNPQEGQIWDLNLAVEVGKIPVQINTISRIENGYLIDAAGDFEWIDITSSDKELDFVEFEVLDNGRKRFRLFYYDEVPDGVLTFELSLPVLKLDGPWQIQWQPSSHAVSTLTTNSPSPDVPQVNPLMIEQVIATEGGFILAGYFGSNEFEGGAQILKTMQHPGSWRVVDNTGQEVPFMDVSAHFPDIHDHSDLGDNFFNWAIELYGKEFNWPLSVEFKTVSVEYPNVQAEFVFDTGPDPQVGQTWDLNLDLNLGAHSLRVISAEFTEDGYKFVAKSVDGIFQVHLAIPDVTDAGVRAGWDGNDQLDIQVQFPGEIPKGKLTIVLSDPKVELQGNWQTAWKSQDEQPNDDLSITIPVPTNLPQVCLTAETLKAVLTHPSKIPPNLSGKVFMTVSDRTLIEAGPVFNAFVANLDGSDRRGIGGGSYRVSPSPDGSLVVYEGHEGPTPGDGLYIENILAGGEHAIPNTVAGDGSPLWSPDGTRIAFMRFDGDSDPNLYIIKPDGTDLQKVIDEAGFEILQSWFPDSSALLFAQEIQGGYSVNKVDIKTGAVSNLLTIEWHPDVTLSPSGNKIAFSAPRAEESYGLYVSNLDGSDRRLIAMSNDWLIPDPVWSPDGNWLVLNLLTPGVSKDETIPVLVNVHTCQISPLPFNGHLILAWIP